MSVIKSDRVENTSGLDIGEVDSFSEADFVTYTHAWCAHMGINMLTHLQTIGRCQIATAEKCQACYADNGNRCYYKNSKSMTRACLMELTEYMRKEYEAKEAAGTLKPFERK